MQMWGSPFNFVAGGDPYFSSVSLLLHMDGSDGSTTFTDSSSNAHTVTANGDAQIDAAQSKFGGASGLFDGAGDYLLVPDDGSFALGSSDFTLDLWVRAAAWSGNQWFVGKKSSGNRRWVAVGSSGSAVRFLVDTGGGSWAIDQSGGSLSADTWHFVRLARSGSSFNLYLDGSSVASGTSSGTITNNTSESLQVGALDQGSPLNPFNGWVDDLRLTIGVARSGSEVPTQAFPDS